MLGEPNAELAAGRASCGSIADQALDGYIKECVSTGQQAARRLRVGLAIEVSADAVMPRLGGRLGGAFTSAATGPKDDVGILVNKLTRLRVAPVGVGVWRAGSRWLIRPEHRDVGPDVVSASLEGLPVLLVEAAARAVDSGDHAGPCQHGGQRARHECRLIPTKVKNDKIGQVGRRHQRVEEGEAGCGVRPGGVDNRFAEEKAAADHQVVVPVDRGLKTAAIVGRTRRRDQLGLKAAKLGGGYANALPGASIGARPKPGDVGDDSDSELPGTTG